MSGQQDVLLALRDVAVQAANGVELVRGVRLDVRRGRVLGLVGESGSGKSLTCLAAMGLLPRGLTMVRGEVLLEGRPIQDLPAEERRRLRGGRLAMIMQNPMSCFNPVVTIRTHMLETLQAHGAVQSGEGRHGRETDARLAAALAEAALPDPMSLLPLYPFQLSGGMLQRVMIAMALLLDAPCLLADEPTTDLDATAQAQILDVLDSLRQRRGLAVLLVTHDLSVVARLADDVAVMRHGHLVEHAPAAQLYRTPQHPYTRRLMAAHLALYGLQLEHTTRQEIPA